MPGPIACALPDFVAFQGENGPHAGTLGVLFPQDPIPLVDARPGRTLIVIESTRQFHLNPSTFNIDMGTAIIFEHAFAGGSFADDGFWVYERLLDGTEPDDFEASTHNNHTIQVYVINSPRDASAGNGVLDGSTVRFGANVASTTVTELVPTRPDTHTVFVSQGGLSPDGPGAPGGWCFWGITDAGPGFTNSAQTNAKATHGTSIGDVTWSSDEVNPGYLMFNMPIIPLRGGNHWGRLAN